MENTNQTKGSEKQIQEIWTDAFITNKAVQLRGKTVNQQFTKAWFQCVDGRTYPLSKTELKEYRPDARIHEDYRYEHDGTDNIRPASPELRTGR
jgi:hypothetical protein